MGIVLRQGFWNSIWIYLGMAIGYFNVMILYPNWMTKDEFGLTRLLLSFSIVAAQFAQLGSGKMVMKFFNNFSKQEKLKNVLLTFGILLSLLGIVLLVLFLYFGNELILGQYKEKSPLFVDYYYYTIPLVVLITFFELFCFFLAVFLNSTVSTFIREFCFRIVQTILLVLFSIQIIDLQLFIVGLILTYCLMAIVVYLNLSIGHRFRFSFDFFSISKKEYKSFLVYAFFILLTTSSSVLVAQIDVLMIGSMSINGLSDVSVYTIGIYMSTIILLPYRGSNEILLSLTAKAMSEKQMEYIKDLYVGSSVIFTALSGLFFVGIWCNMDNLVIILGEGYSEVVWVFLFLGLGKCYDMYTGMNDNILSMSKYYKFYAFNLFALIFIIILFNYWLIPVYGIVGAAISTFLGIVIHNTTKLLLIFLKFKMIPISFKHFLSLITVVASFVIGFYLPKMSNFILDIVIRSLAIFVVFITLFTSLRISKELNGLISKKLRAFF